MDVFQYTSRHKAIIVMTGVHVVLSAYLLCSATFVGDWVMLYVYILYMYKALCVIVAGLIISRGCLKRLVAMAISAPRMG